MSDYKGIEYLARNRVVEEMIDKMNINSGYNNDLAQEVYLILLEYDADKINELIQKKQINFFISRIIMNQVFSSTSDFYRKYVKYDLNKRDITEIDEGINN